MSIHLSTGLPKGSKGHVEVSEGQAEGSEGQPGGDVRTDVRTDGRTEFLPILQDFVPSRGRCPATLCNLNSLVGNRQYWLAGCKFGRVSETLVSGVVLRAEHNLIAYILKKCLGCCKLQHFCRKCAKCAKTRISLEFMHGRLPNFMGMSWEQLWSC